MSRPKALTQFGYHDSCLVTLTAEGPTLTSGSVRGRSARADEQQRSAGERRREAGRAQLLVDGIGFAELGVAAVLVVDERVEPDRHAADEQPERRPTSSRSTAARRSSCRPPAAPPCPRRPCRPSAYAGVATAIASSAAQKSLVSAIRVTRSHRSYSLRSCHC